ncbi:MAG: biotin--[acetyl-CoA-carboxylase] ligase [Deltaproteobacteria bacterium]|jgi:BirA family transcriptional regulator, biotin operon repressor / biotin---[acetyl-CoA-carboxylase] ligase|nr:MAG: biotin--[acetyl-CoA-carboxylase] ligase [Verrucomicrobiota bacterium]TMB67823.1 MAG: biotin--[acetyl-CoA-carboxylase] ligase [Deltaproteobacteria bacterium]
MFPVEILDRLVAGELEAQFSGAAIGWQIIVLEQTGSTNDAILQIATANSNEGLVLFAEHQIAGRGQRGNRWESAAGKGLWFSILLRPEIPMGDSGRLTIWSIQAISDMIRTEFSLEPKIKLPNDVQVRGRKVAGVLVEMRAQEKAPHLAVVGIGINVNQSVEDFPPELQSRAISLAMALGRPVDRQKLAAVVLRTLDRTYREQFGKEITGLQS